MRIYNFFRKEEYTSKFSEESVKNSYPDATFLSSEKESICIMPQKLIFIVKDDELGQKICDIIEYLNSKDRVIKVDYGTFRMSKVVKNWKKDRVLGFYIDYDLAFDANLKAKDKIIQIIKFVERVQEYGYYLSSKDFDIKDCNTISGILSNLHKGGDEEDSKGCIIKIVHYFLSDNVDFDSFYLDISKKDFVKLSEIMYPFPIFRMCYLYYRDNIVPRDRISKILYYSLCLQYEVTKTSKYALINQKNIEIEINEDIKNREELIEYDDNIYIVNKILSNSFGEFLIDNKREIKTFSDIRIISVIYSLDECVVGYKYSINNKYNVKDNLQSIMENNLKSQRMIIDLFNEIGMFLRNCINKCKTNDKTFVEGEFNIRDYIMVSKMGEEIYIKFKGVHEMYMFFNFYTESIYRSIFSLFFENYSKFIEDKYGKIDNEYILYSKNEIRFLSPIIAKECINYILKRDVDYSKLCEKTIFPYSLTQNLGLYYDSAFIYDPTRVKITFVDELENFRCRFKMWWQS